MKCKIPVDGFPCRYDTVKGSNRFCYYHRLMRISMRDQQKEAKRRLSLAEGEFSPRKPKALWPEGERWCAGCQCFVPLFYCSHGARCNACLSMASQNRHREATYGLNSVEFENLMVLQDGRCAICRKHSRQKSLAVDHSHVSGAVRGLLCKSCNHDFLGSAHDSLRRILSAALYMASPPATGRWRDPEDHLESLLRIFLTVVDDLSTDDDQDATMG